MYCIFLYYFRYDTYPQEVHMFVILIAHVNSSCNSILYGITNKQFREGYARILGVARCCPRFYRQALGTTATHAQGGGGTTGMSMETRATALSNSLTVPKEKYRATKTTGLS